MLDGNLQSVMGTSQPPQTPLRVGLSSGLQRQYLFCSDIEGWGPLSPFRYDMTPCFLEIWVLWVAAWGLIMGGGAIWFLLTRRASHPISKNWHFYAKLVSIIRACNRAVMSVNINDDGTGCSGRSDIDDRPSMHPRSRNAHGYVAN